MNKFNNKINDEIRHFINKINKKFNYDYKVVEIRAYNPYDDIIEIQVLLDKEFDYSNPKLRKQEFIFSNKLYDRHEVYLDIDIILP